MFRRSRQKSYLRRFKTGQNVFTEHLFPFSKYLYVCMSWILKVHKCILHKPLRGQKMKREKKSSSIKKYIWVMPPATDHVRDTRLLLETFCAKLRGWCFPCRSVARAIFHMCCAQQNYKKNILKSIYFVSISTSFPTRCSLFNFTLFIKRAC